MTSTPKPGTFKAILREFREGRWFRNAQTRSARRKSPWNFLLYLAIPLWLGALFTAVRLSHFLASLITHGHALGGGLIWPSSFAPALVWFPLLIGTLPLGGVLVNYFIYYCVPPARRAMDAEDKAYPGTEYATAQPAMLRLTLLILPPALLLAVVGQLFL